MLVVEFKDKMTKGGRLVYDWKVIDMNMTLSEFTSMRKTLAEKLPQFYSTTSKFQIGSASGFSLDLMHLLGWIEKNDAPAMRKKAYKVIAGNVQVMAPAMFQYPATYQCRVTHVDGVKLKRRKCFPEQTYSKWLREQGGE